ncbi:MAG: O-antigen ligase family protein [Anaerolineaceae bacterium]|nr:O-antigen ligase family protein [Anaerolineaceae bacterium]
MSEHKSNAARWNIRGILESIDSSGWFILLAATPLFLMIQPEYSWVLLLIPFTWLISVLAKRQPVPVTPMNLAFLVIAVQVLISLYATYDIAVSLQKVTGVIWGMAVFFALVRFGKKRIGIFVTTLIFILGSAGISVLGLLGIEWPTNKIIIFNSVYDQFPKISSLIPGLSEGFHPNEVGGALTWIIPFWMVVLGWLIMRFKKIRKHTSSILIILYILIGLFLLGLSSVVLLFSQSRSAYIGLALGLILLLLVVLPKKIKWGYIFLLIIGVGILTYYILNGQFVTYVNQLFPDSGMASMAFSMNTLSGRVEIWSRAIYAVQDFAFTGMGMNTFRHIVNVLYPLQTISADVPVKDIGHAHNLFLQTALDLGIPGLIGFIGMYMTSFWMTLESLRRLNKSFNRNPITNALTKEIFYVILVGFLGGQIAHLGFSMTDAISFGAKPGILFWVMQAIISAIFLKVRRRDYR